MDTQLISIGLVAWATTIGATDQTTGRIPNLLLLPALVLAAAWLVQTGTVPTGLTAAEALAGAATALMLLLPGYLTRQVGAGDVKCLLVMGLYTGVTGTLYTGAIGYLVLMAVQWLHRTRLAGPEQIEFSLAAKMSRVPLGPGLAIGFVTYLLAMPTV